MDTHHLTVAVEAARAAADELMARRSSRVVREKAPKDLVTDADVAAQQAIRNILQPAFPDYAFVGEEQGETEPPPAVLQGAPDAPPCWIVDPLDGTVNYVHGLPGFAVSIGLWAAGQIRLGVIYDPIADEMFTAVDGQPAVCNGRAIRTTTCQRMDEALVACSFPAGTKRHEPAIAQFIEVLEHCQAVRRLGSCALNMCYVADGRLDAYWATCVKPWDAAAGIAIARQSGASLCGADGGSLDEWDPKFSLAATGPLNQELISLLQRSNRVR